jgi:glycosyltransferase involved in cell wall biosynthesis
LVKPDIAIIHYSAPPIIGGVENVIHEHTLLFIANKYSVKIITGKGTKFHKKVKIKIIPQMLAFEPLNKLISKKLDEGIVSKAFYNRVKFFYKKIKDEIKDRDIIIIHNLLTMHFNMPLTTALVKIIKEVKNKKFISWTHDLTFKDISYKEKYKYRYKFPYSILRTKLKNVKYVAISKFRQEQLAELLEVPLNSIEVVSNGINLKKFLGLKMTTVKILKECDILDSDLIMLYPVRLTRPKNIELAIKITSAINKSGINTILVITGSPDIHNVESFGYYEFLKKLAKRLHIDKKIIFLYDYGEKNNEPLPFYVVSNFYSLCDMLIFPSKQEGFGLPMLEAGISRMPIACSNIPPFEEIGNDLVCLFDLKDPPEKIAKQIIKYLKKNKIPKFFRKIERDYRWQKIFKEKIEPLLKNK